jgi:hypothetical protein
MSCLDLDVLRVGVFLDQKTVGDIFVAVDGHNHVLERSPRGDFLMVWLMVLLIFGVVLVMR